MITARVPSRVACSAAHANNSRIVARQLIARTLALLALIAPVAEAQFRTPVVKDLGADSARADMLRKRYQRLRSLAGSLVARGTDASARAAVLCADGMAMRAKATPEQCARAVDLVDSLRAENSRPTMRVTSLPFRLPFMHGRTDLLGYLMDAGVDENIGPLGDLVTTNGAATSYVSSDLISGVLGRSIFSISYARVVVRDTVADTLTKQLVEDNNASVQRMLNNGGTLAARFVLPMFAVAGMSSRHSVSFYPVVGVDGALDDANAVSFTLSGVLEQNSAMTIRAPNAGSTELGQLEISSRAGLMHSQFGLIRGDDAPKNAGFIQIGLGLRQNGKVGFGVLYTRTTRGETLRPYYPRFQLTLSALGL